MVQGGPIDGRSARGEVSGKDGSNLPRFARVNLVKCSVKNVLSALKKQDVGTPCIDKHFHDLLVFPPGSPLPTCTACCMQAICAQGSAHQSTGTDLHDHPLVKEGKLILQGKASCMTAHALSPEPSWTVVSVAGSYAPRIINRCQAIHLPSVCRLTLARLRETKQLILHP
eukprot:scaffold591_cov372-Prasinococcus_capsulatus_cf.AAC.2